MSNSLFIFKIGTSTLTAGSKQLSRRVMLDFVRQVAALHQQGHQVILVTSGAGAAGREILQHPPMNRTLPFKQMLTSVGQVHLMQIWSELFRIYDIPVGQVLLTRSDFSNRQRYLNARDTLQALLHYNVVPIINENDTVATDEIKVGDNDNLSALVANLLAADMLVLLTDQQGLFTADPRKHADARLIPIVDKIDESVFALAGDSSGGLGTGGMITKLQAAQVATRAGTQTIIASSAHPDVMLKIAAGEHIGTLFKAHSTPRESRKRWVLSEKVQGQVILDAGAANKIAKEGASLLSVGITATKNTFDRGSIVQCISPEGVAVAVGVTNYSSQEIQVIKGLKTQQIEDALGYTCGDEIIHRDDLAVY